MAVIAASGRVFLYRFSMDQRRVIRAFWTCYSKSSDSLSSDRPDNPSGMGKQVKRNLPYGLKHANFQQCMALLSAVPLAIHTVKWLFLQMFCTDSGVCGSSVRAGLNVSKSGPPWWWKSSRMHCAGSYFYYWLLFWPRDVYTKGTKKYFHHLFKAIYLHFFFLHVNVTVFRHSCYCESEKVFLVGFKKGSRTEQNFLSYSWTRMNLVSVHLNI